jgi:hypothetical protein
MLTYQVRAPDLLITDRCRFTPSDLYERGATVNTQPWLSAAPSIAAEHAHDPPLPAVCSSHGTNP